MKVQICRLFARLGACGVLLLVPVYLAGQSTVVEEIVARVNNQIITLTDYQKASADLQHDVAQECPKCPQATLDAEYKDRQKNLLRDMIDQQLLVARGKDMDINVETDLIKQLDDVRKRNNLATIEDLEKAVEGEGISWEDYKQKMRDTLLTQAVIRQEVSGHMEIGSDEIKQYYDAHKQDFVRPEEVNLLEIFLTTQGLSPEETAAVQTKADGLHARVVKGEDFGGLAKRYSDGSTAKDGGPLGTFERGQLDPKIEDAVFKMDTGQVTDVIQTQTGFEILKVENHYQAGLQPLDKVNSEITNKIYEAKMEPALREYLAQLREESYVTVRPGFTDTAAVPGATVIQEVAPTPDTTGKKKKKTLPLPKVSG
ncbi:MAG: peptidylprolyl isomerase [Candidatus Acidiferrales bacterium]